MGAGDFLQVLLGGLGGGVDSYEASRKDKKTKEEKFAEELSKRNYDTQKFARDRNAQILQALATETVKNKAARGEPAAFGEDIISNANPEDAYKLTLRNAFSPMKNPNAQSLPEKEFDFRKSEAAKPKSELERMNDIENRIINNPGSITDAEALEYKAFIQKRKKEGGEDFGGIDFNKFSK